MKQLSRCRLWLLISFEAYQQKILHLMLVKIDQGPLLAVKAYSNLFFIY